jgi:hypothetical protein
MSVPPRSGSSDDDGRPRAWELRQVRPPYPSEELEGTGKPLAPGAPLLHVADAVTIVRVQGLRPFASTAWLTRVLGAGLPGPTVLEVLSLLPAGSGDGEIAFSPGGLPPSLPPSLPRFAGCLTPPLWISQRTWAAGWR